MQEALTNTYLQDLWDKTESVTSNLDLQRISNELDAYVKKTELTVSDLEFAAKIFFNCRQPANTIKTCDMILIREPDNDIAHAMTARGLLSSRDVDIAERQKRAVRLLENFVQRKGTDNCSSGFMITYAHTIYCYGIAPATQRPKAIDILENVVETCRPNETQTKDKSFAKASNMLAVLHYYKSVDLATPPETARELQGKVGVLLTEAIQLAPGRVAPYITFAKFLEKAKNNRELAEQVVGVALARFPKDPHLLGMDELVKAALPFTPISCMGYRGDSSLARTQPWR